MKNKSALALAKKSVEARRKKFGKGFNLEMQRIAKLPRKKVETQTKFKSIDKKALIEATV